MHFRKKVPIRRSLFLKGFLNWKSLFYDSTFKLKEFPERNKLKNPLGSFKGVMIVMTIICLWERVPRGFFECFFGFSAPKGILLAIREVFFFYGSK